jgi:hypothetical protein
MALTAATAAMTPAMTAAMTAAGCGTSPDEAAAGELSAVVVPRNDHPMLLGEGTVDSWSRVIVLTRDELLAAFESSWPGRDVPAAHDIASVVITVDVDDRSPERMAEVREGRFRVPWPVADRYLCLGNEDHGVVTTAGCVLVDAEAPATVTLESSISGFGLEV